MKVSVVIGANYGDEGKGLVVDWLAGPDSLVVRFNGGAQAGHTVETPDGLRHVFSHIGAGTFRGAHTFLSPFFLVNPILFVREMGGMLKKPISMPHVMVDGGCLVTTPYDMMLNTAAEAARGDKRHGSCGVGINETVERSNCPLYQLNYADVVLNPAKVRRVLDNIRTGWVPRRMIELGIKKEPEHLNDPGIVEHFIEDLGTMAKLSRGALWAAMDLVDPGVHLIFEGAQGLGLDQKSVEFPHVTRSNTGLRNVVDLLKVAGFSGEIDCYWVTRCYATRHGAGPLDFEYNWPLDKQADRTNQDNPHQGPLRYGHLNLGATAYRIANEIWRNDLGGIRLKNHVVVTCCDQMDGQVGVYAVDRSGTKTIVYVKPQDLPELISQQLPSDAHVGQHYWSAGPTREAIKQA